MKRINLRGLKEVLSERELKNVLGGSGSGTCGYRGWFYKQVLLTDPNNPNLIYTVLVYDWVFESECNVSLATVQEKQKEENSDFWWCCDHCDTSSYCGNG